MPDEMAESVLEGVILAAGRGTRMSPFSPHYPKPLLPVLNVPLIHHQIAYLRGLGARRVIVVIGHLGHEIARQLAQDDSLGISTEFIEQRDSLGIAHALMQIEGSVSGPFALLLGDIYFEPAAGVHPVAEMQARKADAFLSVHRESDSAAIRRNFAVYLNDDGTVSRVVEKQRFPTTQWKGSGLYLFSESFFDAIRRTPRTAGRDEYELTDAIQIYLEDGAKVLAGTALDWDINLTYPYDLLLANLLALRRQGRQALVAPDAKLHRQVQLKECVIGRNVEISAPIPVTRSLLLDGAVVRSPEPLDRVVVTSDRVVDCRFWINGNGELTPSARQTPL